MTMDLIREPTAVIGTNAWGGALYGKLLRGSSVSEETIHEAVRTAVSEGIAVFDTARDYGLGRGQPMVGRLCGEGTRISAKYTPGVRYKKGQVLESFEKDLQNFRREYVDVYWLHLPNSIEENLSEMASLYRQGRIRSIGISNFNREECRRAKMILEEADIPLYGVQNHYSLLDRTWEQNGLID